VIERAELNVMKGRVGTILLFVTIFMVGTRPKAKPAAHAAAHTIATTFAFIGLVSATRCSCPRRAWASEPTSSPDDQLYGLDIVDALRGAAPPGLTVEAARCKILTISRINKPEAMLRAISSRSASVRVRSERRRTAGILQPCCDNMK
jgi:hypothetical protein